MREITLFLHSQKIQQPEPVLSRAFSRLAAVLRLALNIRSGQKFALR